MDHLDPTRQPPARDALVAALRTRGIGFFAPSDAHEGSDHLSSRQLITALANSTDARLRDGLAALFVRHPELAPEASIALGMLDAAAAEVLRVQYTAAACLQRMWRTTLAHYLPVMPILPDLFGAELALPLLDDHTASGLCAPWRCGRVTTNWLSGTPWSSNCLPNSLGKSTVSLRSPNNGYSQRTSRS